jgi:hypothetical protein
VRRLHAAVFVDVGNAFYGSFDVTKLRVGAGVELRLDVLFAYYLPASKGARPSGLKGRTLAGSALTMIQAVRNAVRFGTIPLHEAVHMASLNPARLINEAHRLGSLEAGKLADLVVFDQSFRVTMTVVGGKIVYRNFASRNFFSRVPD